jgi:hypothetical protein
VDKQNSRGHKTCKQHFPLNCLEKKWLRLRWRWTVMPPPSPQKRTARIWFGSGQTKMKWLYFAQGPRNSCRERFNPLSTELHVHRIHLERCWLYSRLSAHTPLTSKFEQFYSHLFEFGCRLCFASQYESYSSHALIRACADTRPRNLVKIVIFSPVCKLRKNFKLTLIFNFCVMYVCYVCPSKQIMCGPWRNEWPQQSVPAHA